MRLKTLAINNFRAIEDITVSFKSGVDVIVGPNAIGKTSVLEAIRIARAVLAPRIPNEAQQVLIALGAVSPHLPQQINFAALARNPNLPLRINCTYELSVTEIGTLESMIPVLANSIVQSSLGPATGGQLGLVQFLSGH
jgi:hypothetical protein